VRRALGSRDLGALGAARALARLVACVLVGGVASSGAGCSSPAGPAGGGEPRDPDAVAATPPLGAAQDRVLVDLVTALPHCDLDHRGLVFDAGSEAMLGRVGWGVAPPASPTVEHDGATWMRISERATRLSFVLPKASHVFVSLRVAGVSAKSATVLLDDQPLGSVTFGRDVAKVVTTPTTKFPADAGHHTLTLMFAGRLREDQPFADLDWVRVGRPDELEQTFGAPTIKGSVLDGAALGGVPHRAVGLRTPSSLRCTVRPTRDARLRAALGYQGPGAAAVRVTAQVSTSTGDRATLMLAKEEVRGGEGAKWTDLDVPLAELAGRLVTLEITADGPSQGGRFLLGDPAIVGRAPVKVGPWGARAAVVVVLHGVERDELPGYAEAPIPWLDALSELAREGTVFRAHRAPSTYAAATLASLMSERPPSVHQVADPSARLPKTLATLPQLVREAGVHAAMFTGVPFTFKSFGFSEGWERFVEHPPMSGALATAPLTDAAAWVTEVLSNDARARVLAVVHARGGHPPWDVTPREVSSLAPNDYSGPIEPRRAAQVIGRLRKRKGSFSELDHERVRSLAALGLAGQDRALRELFSALRARGLWDQTLVVVVGDTSSGASPAAMFADGLPLGEDALSVPLYVRFPGGALAGQSVLEPTEATDVARTVLDALGAQPEVETSRVRARASIVRLGGRDLFALASGAHTGAPQPSIALWGDRYSARYGEWLITGKPGSRPLLCHVELDPTCSFDRSPLAPFVVDALFRHVVRHEVESAQTRPPREAVTLDQDTAASLNVWGEAG
jgi:hypothetical protein